MIEDSSSFPHGFLLINKPKGVTSFYCVNYIKKILKKEGIKTKVGHGGTLDDFATGLLVVAIGRPATRHLTALLHGNKTYTVTARLNIATDTLDYTGTVLQEIQTLPLTRETFQECINTFPSSYEQVPPIFSALQYKGERLHELARQKKISIEELHVIANSKRKIITIYSLKVLSYQWPFFTLQAHVSKGTYIRSLVYDIALKLGTIATTYELERTALENLQLHDALSLETFSSSDSIRPHLISVEELQSKLERP